MKKEEYYNLGILTVFAVAMAFLESTVVVYLRKLYYPSGFSFPLRGFIEPSILSIERVREFFTIVMLLALAMLAARKFYPRLAYFLYGFAIWDIFYYLWLKVLLNWPSSFFTNDLLFLIPVPWVSPVLAPIICSLTMIVLAVCMLYFTNLGRRVKISLHEWILFILGSIIILCTFIYDYTILILTNGFAKSFFTLAKNQEFINLASSYQPQPYNWRLFIIGEFLILIAIILFFLRTKKN